MKTCHPKNNWLVDIVLFVGFLMACWLELTGVELHQWLGVTGGVFVLYHLFMHWTWVRHVAARFFTTTSNQARIFILLDAALLLGFGAILFTGLVISTWLGLKLSNYAVWSFLHTLASFGTLGLVMLKIGLHWRWIVGVAKRYWGRPALVAPRVPIAQPVPATGISRREFLKFMGVVGIASFVPTANVLDALAHARKTTSAPTSSPRVTVRTNRNLRTTTSGTPTNVCTVRCRKACSYPGQCRKYVDGNNNNRCDLGECL